MWIFTDDCRILQGDFCLENDGSKEPVMGQCKKKRDVQLWKYDTKVFIHLYIENSEIWTRLVV